MARLSAELVLQLVDRVTRPARGVGESLDRLERRQRAANAGMRRQNRLTAQSAASMGAASNMALAGAARAIAPFAAAYGGKEIISSAADFESALTGIQKKAGTTAAETAKMGEEIKALATSGELAVSIEEILGAYERGAAAGLPLDELQEFAKLSAMAADAFEMSAEDVGNAAAGFKTNLGIPINEMERLFDLINGLADSGISDEKDIVSFMDSAGVPLKSFGLANEQIAALGATLLNLKMPAEVAARMMNTLSTKLLTPKATKKSTAAFDRLYGSADEFTELLKEDANGAMVDFLKRIEELDKFKRAEILTDILGQGFSDEVSRLASGMPELMRNLDYAASRDWFGSLGQSYDLKLRDFWSQWQLLKNEMAKLTIDIGTTGMPLLKSGLAEARAIVADVGENLGSFKAKIDVEELNAAKSSIGELIDLLASLMDMGGEGTMVERFFNRVAEMADLVSGSINSAKDALQHLGLVEQDADTPEAVEQRRKTLHENYREFNPFYDWVLDQFEDKPAEPTARPEITRAPNPVGASMAPMPETKAVKGGRPAAPLRDIGTAHRGSRVTTPAPVPTPATVNIPIPTPRPDIEGPVVEEGEKAALKAKEIGDRISQAFSFRASPQIDIDTSGLDTAQRKVNALAASMRELNSLSGRMGRTNAFDGIQADTGRW